MTEILHANIFFIIASIGVTVLTIIACALLYQVYKITRSVRRIVERVESGSEVLVEEITHLRETLNPARLISFVMNFMPGMKGFGKRPRDED